MSRMRQVCKEPLLRLGRYTVQSWIRHGVLLDISSFHSKVWHLDPRKFMLTPLTHREKSWNIVASPFQYPRFWKERRSETCRFFQKFNSPKLDLYWSKLNSSNKFSKGSMLHSVFVRNSFAESLNHVKKNDGSIVSNTHARNDSRMHSDSRMQENLIYLD